MRLTRFAMRRILSLIGALILLVVTFQNCSKVDVQQSFSTVLSSSAQSGGNGGSYDGKLRTYIRYVPNSCQSTQGQKDIFGTLIVDAQKTILVQDACVDMSYEIGLGDGRLEQSIYNPDLIGLNSAIFELKSPAASNPESIDLWCRYTDSQENLGLDIVAKTSLANGAIRVGIFKGENLKSSSPRILAPQFYPAVKSTSNSILSVASLDGALKAEVDLSTRSGPYYQAQARVTTGSQSENFQMSCRVLSYEPAVYSASSDIEAIYQMNEPLGLAGSGAVVKDSSSHGRTGILQNPDSLGASYVSGTYQNALLFDGRNDYVDISPLAKAVSTEMTISLWFKLSPGFRDDHVAFAINTAIGDNILKVGTGMCAGTTDRPNLSFELKDTCYDTVRNVDDQAWHMVTVTVSNGQGAIYVDGVFVEQHPMILPLTPTDVWSIGQDYDGAMSSNDFWDGMIDEVVVWSRVLTSAEIGAAFETSRPR